MIPIPTKSEARRLADKIAMAQRDLRQNSPENWTNISRGIEDMVNQLTYCPARTIGDVLIKLEILSERLHVSLCIGDRKSINNYYLSSMIIREVEGIVDTETTADLVSRGNHEDFHCWL